MSRSEVMVAGRADPARPALMAARGIGPRPGCVRWAFLAAAWGLMVAGGGGAEAQEQVGKFTQPIPVLSTGGHHAPVRALIFAPDGSQLLSAGLDKVIHVWNLQDGRPRLARTIRPPLWRGWRGVIYAMALAPPPAGGRGPQVLAVAGFGVESQRGNIALYGYSSRDDPATGTVLAMLRSGNPADRDPEGHTDTVMGLAFAPGGRSLASCSLDATIRIWDVAQRRTVAILRGHAGAVNALAYSPDGRRLATGGADGVVRIWDADRPAAPPVAIPPNPRFQVKDDPRGDAINALAYSPDGKWIVIGRENGLLVRYDAATRAERFFRTTPEQGAVEALAFNRDGSRLATSLVAHRPKGRADRPRNDCDVEVRAMPDGEVVTRLPAVNNMVYACAFGPDDRSLAYAGGDLQGVYLKDLRDPKAPEAVLNGTGRSIWDVGFRRDSRAVGYLPIRPEQPGGPPRYWGFDLGDRKVVSFGQGELARAVADLDGWTIRPIDPYTLDLARAGARGFRLKLDEEADRRWWSWSFIPAGPGHARPTVAIGCEGGVAFFRLDTGARTRLYTGHQGPVYALAPSPDGRWLVTGSSDQTVRLWRLAGCDAIGPLGAAFGRNADGATAVTTIEPRSFAQAMDLRPGDVLDEFFLGRERLRPQDAPGRVDAEPPGHLIQLRVRRGPKREVIDLNSAKHDAPALTLFPGDDREWILWMTDGFYETSKAGDRRYLGWHRNPAPDRLDQPTDFFAADKFEEKLRQPKVLDRLLETADVGRALGLLAEPDREPGPAVADAAPPITRIVEPARPLNGPLVVQAAGLPVRALIRSGNPSGVGVLRFRIDGRKAREDLTYDPPRAAVDVRVDLALPPGLHRVSVIAVNDRGKERVESFDVDYRGPLARPSRLVVLSIGVGDFPRFPDAQIPFADADAEDIKTFLVAPGGRERFASVEARALTGAGATARGILASLDELDARLKAQEFQPGDTVLVAIESHILTCKQGGYLAVADAGAGMPPTPSLAAADVADLLGRLADYGCRVMLLLDAVHEQAPQGWRADVDEWVRDLYRKRGVIVFVASNQGPGERIRRLRRGAFAQGVVTSFDAGSQVSLPISPDGPIALDDFQEAVRHRVQVLTGRRQFAFCYVPETIPPRLPILAAQPPWPARRPAGD